MEPCSVSVASLALIGNDAAGGGCGAAAWSSRVIFDKETRRKPLVGAAARLWRKNRDGTLEGGLGLAESEDVLLETRELWPSYWLDSDS